MPKMTTKDGTEIFYKDWGHGPPVVLSHGWPLNSDSWDDQAFFLASNGYRVIAYDRRGFGKSSQTWGDYGYDTLADDLHQLFEGLHLKGASLFGFSMGGGEIARYIGRYGTHRLAKAGLLSAVPPLMLQTEANPEGLPISVFDGFRDGITGDRPQTLKEIAKSVYGVNRPGAQVSQGTLDMFWEMSVKASFQATFACIKTFSETDISSDFSRFDIPTLIVHGDADEIVPIGKSGVASASLIPTSILKVYGNAPHGLITTHKAQLNADLLAFLAS